MEFIVLSSLEEFQMNKNGKYSEYTVQNGWLSDESISFLWLQ